MSRTMKNQPKAAEAAAEQPKPAKKPAAKKPAKYTDEVRAITKSAQSHRGRPNPVAPVTVVRVQALLEREGKTPDQIVKAFKQGGRRLRERLRQDRQGACARR
jgi:hypothetical protein